MVCKRGKGLDLGAELPPSPLQNFVEVSLGGGGGGGGGGGKRVGSH